MTTAEAIEATKKELGMYPIALRDTRIIPIVSQNSVVFSDKVPVFFRADLLRAIISLYEIQTGSTKCFIFSNCNMAPISKTEIFDERTLMCINKLGGLVMAFNKTGTNANCDNKTDWFENSFFLYSNTDPIMEEALDRVLIQGSIDVAKWVLTNCMATARLTQHIYFSYGKVFTYYYAKTIRAPIGRLQSDGSFEEFDSEIPIKEHLQQGVLISKA